jgi:hypothetical protein
VSLALVIFLPRAAALTPVATGSVVERHGDVRCSRRGRLELSTGADAELGEDLPQVPFDGRADEQRLPDLRIRVATCRELAALPLELRDPRLVIRRRAGAGRRRRPPPAAPQLAIVSL